MYIYKQLPFIYKPKFQKMIKNFMHLEKNGNERNFK